MQTGTPVSTSGAGTVTYMEGGILWSASTGDDAMGAAMANRVGNAYGDNLAFRCHDETAFDPAKPELAIGNEIAIKGLSDRTGTTYVVGYVDATSKHAYCYRNVHHFGGEFTRPTKVPFSRIQCFECLGAMDTERTNYLSTERATKDFSRSGLSAASILYAPFPDDQSSMGPPWLSVHTATSYAAAHPSWRHVLGYELCVCQCGAHANSCLHAIVKKGADHMDLTERDASTMMHGMRFFVPDPALRDGDLTYLRALGNAGAFEGTPPSVFHGPGNITFLPSHRRTCEGGLRPAQVVRRVIGPDGQMRTVEDPQEWQVSRKALLKLHEAEVTLPPASAPAKTRRGLVRRVAGLGIGTCSDCALIDVVHTSQRLCGACVGELPEDAFQKLRDKAADREEIERLQAVLRDAEARLQKAQSRAAAVEQAERDAARRATDARPGARVGSKKKNKVASRAERRAEGRLSEQELAHDADKARAYQDGVQRDRALREAADAVEQAKAAVKAERKRLADAGARLEAARHAVPPGPQMADFLAQALAKAP
jgi:hypothetical protein